MSYFIFYKQTVNDAKYALEILVNNLVRPVSRSWNARVIHHVKGEVHVPELLFIIGWSQVEGEQRNKVSLEGAKKQDEADTVMEVILQMSDRISQLGQVSIRELDQRLFHCKQDLTTYCENGFSLISLSISIYSCVEPLIIIPEIDKFLRNVSHQRVTFLERGQSKCQIRLSYCLLQVPSS